MLPAEIIFTSSAVYRMTSSDRANYYTFEPPPRGELEPTLESRERWVAGLMKTLEPGGLSIFAYGSLIWNTDFPVAERAMARAYGYHRSFCVYSFHYRGTRERPGLVLGLDRGGSCQAGPANNSAARTRATCAGRRAILCIRSS